MTINKALHLCIGDLYRATSHVPLAEYRQWALARVGSLIPFDGALWGTGHTSTQRFHTRTVIGVEEKFADQLVKTIEINPITQHLFQHIGEPVDMADVIHDEAFYQSDIYRTCFQPQRIERVLSSIHIDERSGVFTVLSLYRFDRAQRFSEQDKLHQKHLLFHMLNAASHCGFLTLDNHHQRQKGEVCAICDAHGNFHEVESRFLDLIEQYFGAVHSRCPFPMVDAATEHVQIRCVPVGDLFRVSLWPNGPLELLTEREREIVYLCVQGLSAKVIGKQLQLASSTVSNHLYKAYEKLGISSKAELVALLGRE